MASSRSTRSRAAARLVREYTDTQGRTDAQAYLEGALDGSVVAGERLKQLARKYLPRIGKGYKRWRFDAKAAVKPVAFIERFCRIPSGKLGQPFILEPYERMIVELIFGFVDADGRRQHQYALVEVARKNGKTSLVAAIELYMLLSDGEGAPQVYNSATSKAQASLGYGAVWRMVRQSPELKRFLRKGIVPERAEDGIICDGNMGYICVLSKQSDHLDGLDVHCGVMDELAAEKDRSAFDLVRQGMGARDQPMLIVISTQGFVRDNIWDHERDYAVRWLEGEIEDDRFLGILFELDGRDEWRERSCWPKANPGLGTVKKWDYLDAQVQKAENDPSYLPTLLTKDFNVPANQAAAFLTWEECHNDEAFDPAGMGFKYCIVGFDAADTVDLSAAKALMMVPGDDRIYERSMYWVPEESIRLADGNRRERDDVPYHEWEAQGLLRIVPGNKVPKSVFLEWMQELYAEGIYTYAVGYDPWHVDDTTERNLKGFVGENGARKVIQGPKTLSQPMKQMKADLRAGRFVNNGNPVDAWCRMNVAVKTDINDNIQPVKSSGPKTRIDGFMAELDAYVVLLDVYDDYMAIIS